MNILSISERVILTNIVDSIQALQDAEKHDKQVLPKISPEDPVFTMIKEGQLRREGMLEGYLSVISSVTQNGNWMYLDDPEMMSNLYPKVSWSMIRDFL